MVTEQIGMYLKAEKLPQQPNRKTSVWRVFGSVVDETLGHVKWFGRWRQYTFHTTDRAVFNRECLLDLVVFLEKVNREHREKQSHG